MSHRYKNVLSWFNKEETQKELHKNDTVDIVNINSNGSSTKEVVVKVPILEEENIWDRMAIDEKNIWWEIYTILSNRKSWKIALMANTVKSWILETILHKLPTKAINEVKSVTMDLNKWFEKVAKKIFCKAKLVGDKFHVICLALGALQDIRIRCRQKALREERQRRLRYEEKENERRQKAMESHKKYKKEKYPSMKKYSNWETKLEILSRSRYLLFVYEREWTSSQRERAEILFWEFPEIKKAYKIICSFRSFYNNGVWRNSRIKKAEKKLIRWSHRAEFEGIEEINNFIFTVMRNKEKILNYFSKWETNAFAESMNNRIQRFVHQNYWVKNVDFFHFRIKKFFS